VTIGGRAGYTHSSAAPPGLRSSAKQGDVEPRTWRRLPLTCSSRVRPDPSKHSHADWRLLLHSRRAPVVLVRQRTNSPPQRLCARVGVPVVGKRRGHPAQRARGCDQEPRTKGAKGKSRRAKGPTSQGGADTRRNARAGVTKSQEPKGQKERADEPRGRRAKEPTSQDPTSQGAIEIKSHRARNRAKGHRAKSRRAKGAKGKSRRAKGADEPRSRRAKIRRAKGPSRSRASKPAYSRGRPAIELGAEPRAIVPRAGETRKSDSQGQESPQPKRQSQEPKRQEPMDQEPSSQQASLFKRPACPQAT
jgi:hypothetical protein